LHYQAPPRSGFGASGTVAVVLVAALEQIRLKLAGKDTIKINKQKIVYLAHLLEASLGFSITGLQDQCAAMYGGTHLWTWQYSKQTKFLKREIMSETDSLDFENRLVIAYLKTPHNSTDTNSQNISSFFSLKDRLDWIRFNQNTMEFSNAIKSKNWKIAIKCIQFENQFRQKIAEGRLLPIGFELWEIAKQTNAGFSTCGAGGGGCVWAITETPEEKQKLASQFSNIVGPENILNSKLDFQGIKFS
jgi:D-glycero-alpha-D-manno-heptose-7-phosphate kinase